MERLIVWHRWLPPCESSPEAIAQAALWRIAARERFAREAGEVLMELGGAAAFALEPHLIGRTIEHCLSLIEEFEAEEHEAGSVSFGLTLGSVERTGQGAALGEALDLSQVLANLGEPFEIVLDASVQAAASNTYLLGRKVSALNGIEAQAIDRHHPRRSDCARAVLHLKTPVVRGTAQHLLEQVRKLAAAPGRHRLVIIGPYGAGVGSWVEHIAQSLRPCLWLDVQALSSALAPLSGLMYALRRLPENVSPERVLVAQDEPDRQSLATLRALREGGAVSRRDAIMALRQYLGRAHEQSGRPVLLTVNPGPLIDPATVGVMAEVTRDGGPDGLLVLRMPLDAKAPEAFARGGRLSEIRVPGLTQQEARALALSMLGKDASPEIARRAAAMGGNTPLGVAEAVRVLVTSGDVVFDGERFQWRRGPAGRVNTMTVEALLEERIDELPSDARRMLQVLAIVPDPEDTPIVSEVADAEGLRDSVREDAVEELSALSLLERSSHGLSVSVTVRSVVLGSASPDRLQSLHRHVARALARTIPGDDAFSRATLAYHMAQAGKVAEAVDILLTVAGHAGRLGFLRSGVRLAATAVECDPSAATRARAAELAEELNELVTAMRRAKGDALANSADHPPSGESMPVPPSAPEATRAAALSSHAQHQAVEAILARDFDAVERSLELVVAAGRDTPSVDRLRAVTALVKGDRGDAMRLLDRARQREGQAGCESARTAIATALVLLETGELGAAVRESLRALSIARAESDGAGEQAALATLSVCYRKLGRDDEADSLAGLKTRAALPPAPLGGSSQA